MLPPRVKGRYPLRKAELNRQFTASGMTLKQFADKMHMSVNGLKAWLSEECEAEANYSSILEAARVLRVKPSDIAEGVPESEEQMHTVPPDQGVSSLRYKNYTYEDIERLRELIHTACRLLKMPEDMVTINDHWQGSVEVELVGPAWAIDRLVDGARNGELDGLGIDRVTLYQDGSQGERQRRIEATGQPIVWQRGEGGVWSEQTDSPSTVALGTDDEVQLDTPTAAITNETLAERGGEASMSSDEFEKTIEGYEAAAGDVATRSIRVADTVPVFQSSASVGRSLFEEWISGWSYSHDAEDPLTAAAPLDHFILHYPVGSVIDARVIENSSDGLYIEISAMVAFFLPANVFGDSSTDRHEPGSLVRVKLIAVEQLTRYLIISVFDDQECLGQQVRGKAMVKSNFLETDQPLPSDLQDVINAFSTFISEQPSKERYKLTRLFMHHTREACERSFFKDMLKSLSADRS